MDSNDVKRAIHAIRELMDANRDRLIELDGAIGDGDLGLTMTKGFAGADEAAQGSDEKDVGKLLALVGLTIAKTAPSTMGTLLATGFMRGGKAVRGKQELDPADLATFFRAFADGMMDRGKCAPGEKTAADVMVPVADAVGAHHDSYAEPASAGLRAAAEGFDAATEMIAQHGKAAVFREQTRGKKDAGCAAAVLVVQGLLSTLADGK